MASEELKNTLVSAVQGRLNLDDNLHIIADGDGRERRNIMIGYEGKNGVVEPVRNYKKIPYVDSATVHGWCADKYGNVYYVASYQGELEIFRTFYVYEYVPSTETWTLVLQTTDELFDYTERIDVKYGDGYVFITQLGYNPLMIDIAKNKEFLAKDKAALFSVESVGGFAQVNMSGTGWIPENGATVSIMFRSEYADLGAINGVAMVVSKNINGSTYDVLLDIETDIDIVSITGTAVGYIVDGEFNYAPFYELITTAKPVPSSTPRVEMISAPDITYNHFTENIYTFGYSFLYYDGYETPMSPLSVIDLTKQEEAGVYRQNMPQSYNKAKIQISPYCGVEKVRIYTKKNSEANDFILIEEVDSTANVIYEYDGSGGEDTYSNADWVKASENIPLSASIMEYLPDDRICYLNCNEGREKPELKIFAEAETTNYSVTDTVTIVDEYAGTYTDDYAVFDFQSKISIGTSTEVGTLAFAFRMDFGTSVASRPFGTFYGNVTVDIAIGDDEDDILSNVVDAINTKYGTVNLLGYNSNMVASVDSVTKVKITISGLWDKFFSAYASINYRFGNSVYKRTLKSGIGQQFGLVYYDKYGRSCSVITNESCKINWELSTATSEVTVAKPILYWNGSAPAWATHFQFVVNKSSANWAQYIIPCNDTDGTWGTTSPPVSNAIKKFDNNVYGIYLNRLISDTLTSTNSTLIYQYRDGDYIRYIRYYDTIDRWKNVVDDKVFRITGIRTDDDGVYALIDNTSGLFDYVWDAYVEVKNVYLQFEVFNTEVQTNVWTEIGNRYSVIDTFTSEEKTYPEDEQAYAFYKFEVDYGNAIVRPIYRANLDLPAGYNEYMFHIETPYIFDSNNTIKLFNVGRPHARADIDNKTRSIVRHGGKKFDGTEVDNRRKFDLLDYQEIGNEYGDAVNMKQRGDTLRVYCPYRTATIYINAVEGNLPDGTTNLLYTDKVFGTLRWSNEKYGCSDVDGMVSTGRDIYFYDKICKEIIKDTVGGMYPISGYTSIGENSFDGKVRSFISGDSYRFGYCPQYRQLYVTRLSDNSTIVFSENRNVWECYYDIAPLHYLTVQNELWSRRSNISYVHHASTTHSSTYVYGYNSSDVEAGGTYTFDVVIAPERNMAKNYMAVLQHIDTKQDVYLNTYSKDWSTSMYTKIPKGIFEKWDDMYYAQVTKGSDYASFKTYKMYEGDDMVGKCGVFKISTSEDFELSALEVRYSLRNR